VSALSAADLAAWRELEARAAEPNVYQSADFVLPALAHLDPEPSARILLVEGARPGRLIGAAALRPRSRSAWMRLPHVEVYLSRHSFLGAPLLEAGEAGAAIEIMRSAIRHHWPAMPVLLIRRIEADGPVAQACMSQGLAQGLPVVVTQAEDRAVLRPGQPGPDPLQHIPVARLAELKRCRRRLGEAGALSWAFLDGCSGRDDADSRHRTAPAQAIARPTTLQAQEQLARAGETFLRLEHLGWKAEAGTSLLSQAADTAFFRACTQAMACRGQLWFTELRLDGQAIASTCNFLSGGAGFAFKLGWDPAWRRVGPGWLNEAGLVETAAEHCADMAWIDSGAAPDSFINSLWTEKRRLVDLAVPLSTAGLLALRGLGMARRISQALRGRRTTHLSPSP
jgi:CelD/BcsL family acetyltransferase involved in cellulose biosynthesis